MRDKQIAEHNTYFNVSAFRIRFRINNVHTNIVTRYTTYVHSNITMFVHTNIVTLLHQQCKIRYSHLFDVALYLYLIFTFLTTCRFYEG